jgi:hypothetical protein
MVSARSELADDVCPVRDELLGELYRANDLFVPGFVYTLAPDIRRAILLSAQPPSFHWVSHRCEL